MKRHDYTLYFMLLAAFFLRLYFALTVKPAVDYSDMALYNELASAGGFPTSLPPLYPLFLRLVYSIFGASNYTAVFVIQAVLSVATVWLFYYVTAKIEDERAGLVAAAFATIYPVFIAYNLTTMTESLSLLVVMLLLAVFVKGMDERRRSILAAAAIAVGFYLRPVFLFFIPGVFLLTKKRLWFVGAIVALMAPWFIYGAVAGGGDGRAPKMFYKTYNEYTDGITNYDLEETELGEDGVPGGTYVREAFRFIGENGWQTVNILYNKFALVLARGYDQYVLKPHLMGHPNLAYFFYHFHIPIFILGLIMMIRFYSRDLNVLILPGASYLLGTILLMFFKFRYRLPAEPMLLIAASILLSRWGTALAGRFRRTEVPATTGKKKKDKRDRKRKKKKPAAGAAARDAAQVVDAGAGFGGFFAGILAYVRENWKLIAGLFVGALSLKILFLATMGAAPLREDSAGLLQLAVHGGIGPGDAPLYPLLLRFLFFVTGGRNLLAVYIVQMLAGTASVLLIYAITLKMFDRTLAVAAAVVAALHVKFMLYDMTVGPRSLSILLFCLLIAFVLSGLRGRYRSAACGLLVALGTMTQPHFLFLAPGLLLVADRKKIFLAALAAALLPLAVRNSIVSGSPLLVYPAPVFEFGVSNFFGLKNNAAIVDILYYNFSIIFSRGWDKQQQVDLTAVLYIAQYGYVLLMTAGLAGLARYARREHARLLLPVAGYFVILVLLSKFSYEKRVLVEPLLVIYTGVLLAGMGRYLLSLLRRGRADQDSAAADAAPAGT